MNLTKALKETKKIASVQVKPVIRGTEALKLVVQMHYQNKQGKHKTCELTPKQGENAIDLAQDLVNFLNEKALKTDLQPRNTRTTTNENERSWENTLY